LLEFIDLFTSRNSFTLVKEIKDVTGTLVVDFKNGPQCFNLSFAFMGISFSYLNRNQYSNKAY